MGMLANIEKTLYEITQFLAQDEVIQRLLTIDSSDALTKQYAVQTAQAILDGKYVTNMPILENGIVDKGRNTFMIISLQEFSYNTLLVNGSIHIATDLDHVLLQGNHNRLIQLADRIGTLLENRKFSSVSKIELKYGSQVLYGTNTFGYSIMFSFADQENGKAEL